MLHLLMILGFLSWWPLGLLFLGIVIGRRKFASCRNPSYAGDAPMFDSDRRNDRWQRKMERLQEKMGRVREMMDGRQGWGRGPTSGNSAFDDYRTQTLKRLEEEQREFKDFLERLRFAKDRSEFDQFMSSRRQGPQEPEAGPAT